MTASMSTSVLVATTTRQPKATQLNLKVLFIFFLNYGYKIKKVKGYKTKKSSTIDLMKEVEYTEWVLSNTWLSNFSSNKIILKYCSSKSNKICEACPLNENLQHMSTWMKKYFCFVFDNYLSVTSRHGFNYIVSITITFNFDLLYYCYCSLVCITISYLVVYYYYYYFCQRRLLRNSVAILRKC